MKIRSIITIFLFSMTLSLSSQRLKLFSSTMRESVSFHQNVVMDFLERYFGEELPSERQTSWEHKMADDRVSFRIGKVSDLKKITDSMPFSIILHDRYYEVQWMQHDTPFVSIVFPAQYDLLLGMQQNEAQQRLKEKILTLPKLEVANVVPLGMESLEDRIYVSKKEKFELESLNDAMYYKQDGEEWNPVFDDAHPEYSVANLFHGLIPNVDYRMYVEQSVYGMKSINYSLTLSQWLNYCAVLGMKVFFGIEEERKDGMLAIVLAQCKELGFNHMLSVVIPDKFVENKNAVLKVRLIPYIPSHNVKDLYQKKTSKSKKKVWQ